MALNLEEMPLAEICARFGVNEKALQDYRNILKEWLSMQRHLPEVTPDRRLDNIIISAKFSLEVAKKKLESYFMIKSILPEIFLNRNPLCHSMRLVQDNMTFVFLPKLTPEGYNVSLASLAKSDASGYDYADVSKYVLMLCEIRGLEYQYNMGDVLILDFANLSLSHIARTTPMTVKKSLVATINGLGARIKSIHYINGTIFMDRLVALVKPVLKPKLQKRLHVHRNGDMESLFRLIPKSIMPRDYGGDERPVSELKHFWYEKVKHHHDWFIQQDKALIDESLRLGERPNSDIFGFSGSFRKLDID